jgi:hypothetical protein
MFAIYQLNGKKCDLVHENTHIAKVLCAHIDGKRETMKPKDDTMPWELSGRELCRRVIDEYGIEKDAASCKVVIDVVPKRKDALLLEINRIWGFSYGPWTPILLQMSTLFEGKRREKATPVKHFRLGSQGQGFVHEFLYLQWGHGKGKQGNQRNWGRMGYTNAALLYPDALVHLLGKIGFKH